MNFSKNVKHLVNDIVSHYAKYCSVNKQYYLSIDNVPDFDLQELAALIMSEDESLASEATGLDNPDYIKKMLPALNKFLKKSTDKDEQIEFISAWKEGVISYFKRFNIISDLLEESIYQMNCNLCHYEDHEDARKSYTDPYIGRSVWL
jgi:hypothetical protein